MYNSRGRALKTLRHAAFTMLLVLCASLLAACSGALGVSPNAQTPGAEALAVDKPVADPNDPTKLASGWTWHQGESKESAFKLEGGALTITAGPKTEQWGETNSAPYVAYDIEGDFSIQTKLDFDNGRVAYWAGIGIMSADDPTQWVRLAPRGHSALSMLRNGGQEITATADFPVTSVYLRIQRRGDVISASYSKDGTTWQSMSETYEFTLPKKVKMYLVALALDEGISANFSNVKITPA